jgi:fructosamine-3-kinase
MSEVTRQRRLPGSLEHVVRRAIGTPATPMLGHRDLHNVHCRATTPAGTSVFVKTFDERGYWQRAISAAPVVEGLWRTPRLLDCGQLDQGHCWATYEWLDLEPFAPTPDALAQLGRMVGRLHAAAGVAAGFAVHDLGAEVDARVEGLARLDPDAARRAQALLQRHGPANLDGPVSLLHGDLHWRNAGMVGTEVVLFDLENTQAGHPLIDFAKLVDLNELADPARRTALFAGYESVAPPVWPWPAAMRTVRLWTTYGVLIYSLTRGLTEFAAHGYRGLAALEAESGLSRARSRRVRPLPWAM